MRRELGTATVVRADARSLPLDDDSVDLIVTSPPYFALRSYQDGGEHYEGQIGDEVTPAEFVDALLEVTRECVRVLKPTGSLWVNLGDKYAAKSGAGPGIPGATSSLAGRDRLVEAYTPTAGRAGVTDYGGVPAKSLIGVPWRYAIRCIDELGLILRAEVVWSKPNALPESVTDRVRRSHEQWFHFTLRERYFAAVDEIREPHNGARKSPGGGDPARAVGPQARVGGSQWERTRADREATVRHPLGRLPSSVWTIASEPLKVPAELGVDHFAAFPTEWPRRLIMGFAPTAICTACDEGLRPVTRTDTEVLRQNNNTNRPKRQDLGVNDGGWNKLGEAYPLTRTSVTITGYACACNEPIATPTGDAGEPDPSLEVGRAGLSRPRADGAGVRVVTRWEQRHEAEQLRVSPHREQMQLEAGAAFAHYLRTDRAGARPIPEQLREQWRARGWLDDVPEYVPAPTRRAVVLDPFGGTGTVAMVAKALGRHGVSVDLSADYCRLAEWRTNDRDQLAGVLGIAKVEKPDPAQLDLFTL